MATKSENADIAVLQSQMKSVLESLSSINSKLDNTFVTKAEFNEFKQRWLFSHIIVGILSALVTGLTVYYLTRR